VRDALALQWLGELPDFGDQLAAADVCVVGERLLTDGDWLEHAAARYPSQIAHTGNSPAALPSRLIGGRIMV
jgi:hypothetical protein